MMVLMLVVFLLYGVILGSIFFGKKSPDFCIIGHLHRQFKWSLKTFGPGDRTFGVVDHIRKELLEIEECDGEDLEEWIDVIILACDGAQRKGYTPEEICATLVRKYVKNKQRKWPDWRAAEPGKAICHIK